MKITHLIFAFPNGGAENLLVDIINKQAIYHKITIIIINNIVDENLISKISKNVNIKRFERVPNSKSPIPFAK